MGSHNQKNQFFQPLLCQKMVVIYVVMFVTIVLWNGILLHLYYFVAVFEVKVVYAVYVLGVTGAWFDINVPKCVLSCVNETVFFAVFVCFVFLCGFAARYYLHKVTLMYCMYCMYCYCCCMYYWTVCSLTQHNMIRSVVCCVEIKS